ncbi:hypothetical protein CHS0354_021847 [Potamilus streckersoni]|uniref:Claudin n=1 Tax=Potamilus streckersoni TaxID=2493646 RepID=A0AAE0TEG5_9BIVA|nr:hypothetical protein CHS0354_021847 [Potamilus streckersoni]
MGIIGIAGFICSIVSLILIVIAIAIPYWERTVTEQDGNMYVGLWMNCTRHGGGEAICGQLNTVQEYVLVARAFIILGLFLVAGAAVLGFIRIFVMKENQTVSHAAAAVSIGAGMFMLIGAIVYSGRRSGLSPGEMVNYHAGFGFAILAGGIALFAGILYIAGRSNQINKIKSMN